MFTGISILLQVPGARLAMFECDLRRTGHTVHMQIDLQTSNYTKNSSNTRRGRKVQICHFWIEENSESKGKLRQKGSD